MGARADTRGRWARSGATISGAGPTVLVWCDFESTGAVAARLDELAEGWAEVMRVPFTATGAEVRSL